MNVHNYSSLLFSQVSKERGEQLAIEYGIKFMETSAKASINVEDAFFTLARDIKVLVGPNKMKPHPPWHHDHLDVLHHTSNQKKSVKLRHTVTNFIVCR